MAVLPDRRARRALLLGLLVVGQLASVGPLASPSAASTLDVGAFLRSGAVVPAPATTVDPVALSVQIDDLGGTVCATVDQASTTETFTSVALFQGTTGSAGTPVGAITGIDLATTASTGCATMAPATAFDILGNPNGYYIQADTATSAVRGQLADPASIDVVTTVDMPAVITAGEDVTFTGTVENNGPAEATINGLFLGAYSTGAAATLVTPLDFPGSTCTPYPGSSTLSQCSITLAPGARVAYSTTVNFGPGSHYFYAFVFSTTQTDYFISNDRIANEFSVDGPDVDLAVTKTLDAGQTPAVGQPLTWTVRVTNAGPDTAAEPRLSDFYPSGFAFGGMTSSGTTLTGCTDDGFGTASCELDPLFAGAAVDVTVTATPNVVGCCRYNYANVSDTTSLDGNLGNNEANDGGISPTGPEADLATTLQVDPAGGPRVGETFTVTFTVTNNGPETAPAVLFDGTVGSSGGGGEAAAFTVASLESPTPSQGTCGAPDFNGRFRCELGALAPATTATIVVVATPEVVNSYFPVEGYAFSDQAIDPNSSDNYVFESWYVTGDYPSISVYGYSLSGTVNTGRPGTFAFSIGNNGTITAEATTLTIVEPAGVTFTSLISPLYPNGTGCTEAGGTITCSFGDIPAGTNFTAYVRVTPDASLPVSSTFTLVADLTTTTAGDPYTFDQSTEPSATIVEDTGSLNYTQATTQYSTVAQGDRVRGNVYAQNYSGGNGVTNAVAFLDLPEGVSVENPAWAYAYGGTASAPPTCALSDAPTNTWACELGDFPRYSYAQLDFDYVVAPSVPVGTAVPTAATVGSDQQSPVAVSYLQVSTVVAAGADLSVYTYLATGSSPIEVGDTPTFEVQTYNAGPSTATNTIVTDTLPAGFTFVAAELGDGTPVACTGSTVVACPIGDVPRGSNRVLRMTAQAPASPASGLTNRVEVASDIADPNPSSNAYDQAVAVVDQEADLGISMSGPGSGNIGQQVGWSVYINNSGPGRARDVTVVDTMPSGVDTLSGSSGYYYGYDGSYRYPTCTPDEGAGTVTCSFGSQVLPPGYGYLSFYGYVRTTGLKQNSATISSSTPEPATATTPNTATDEFTVNEADLTVSILDVRTPVELGSPYIYRVDVTNVGNDVATDISLTDTIPAGTLYYYRNVTDHRSAATDPSGFVCTAPAPDLACTLGSLNPGQRRIVEVYVIPAALGTSSSTAMVSMPATENIADNTATSNVSVVAATGPGAVRHQPGFVANTVPGGEYFYGDSGPITLPFTVDYFGTPVSTIYASQSGVIGFGQDTNNPQNPLDPAQRVAVLFGDYGSTYAAKAHKIQYGAGTVDGRNAFAVTYEYVAQYPGFYTDLYGYPVSSYQLVIIDRSDLGPNAFDLEFNYDHVKWRYSFGYAGYNPGTGDPGFALPGSGTTGVLDSAPGGGLIAGTLNAGGQLGRYTFPVGYGVTTADFAVAMTDTPDPVAAGQTLTQQVAVTNDGPENGSVNVSIPVPSGTTYTGFTGSGVSCSNVSNAVQCSLALDVGAANTFDVSFAVNPDTRGTISTTATLSAPGQDANPANDTASSTTTVTEVVDLYLYSGYDTVDPVILGTGQQTTHQLFAYNYGPSTALGATLHAIIPDGLNLDSSSLTCAPVAGGVDCSLPNLGAGQYSFPTFTYSGTTVGDKTVQYTLDSVEIDSNAGNDSLSLTTTVAVDEVDVRVDKSASRARMVVGEPDYFDLSSYNRGPAVARDTTVTDTLPGNFTITGLSFDGSGLCSVTGQTVRCNYGNVGANDSRFVRVNVIPVTAGNGVDNTATITTSTPTVNRTRAQQYTAGVGQPVTTVGESFFSRSRSLEWDGSSSAVLSYYQDGTGGVSADDGLTVTVNGTPTTYNACTYYSGSPIDLTSRLVAGTNTVDVEAHDVCGIYESVSPVWLVQSGAAVDSTTATVDIESNQADLSVAKFASRSTMVVGEPGSFDLYTGNSGPAIARNVTTTDVVPSNFTINSLSGESDPDPATNCSFSGQTVTCTYPTLPANGIYSAYVRVNVTPVASGDDVTNTVTVSSSDTSEPPDAAQPNSASVTVDVAPNEADLSVTKNASRANMVVGEAGFFDISTYNAGPAVARAVVTTDDVPADFRIERLEYDSNCATSGQTVTCSYGDIGAGQSRFVRVHVTPIAANPATNNTATVSTTTVDPNTANNTDPAPVNVQPNQAELGVSKFANRTNMVVGEAGFFDIYTGNLGPASAYGVMMTDAVPPNFTITSLSGEYRSGSAGSCGSVGQTVTCTYDNLPPNGLYSAYVRVNVMPVTAGAAVVNTATMTSTVTTDTDNNPAITDSSSVTVEVLANEADLRVSKSANRTGMVVGETGFFDISTYNAGPAIALGVVTSDEVPAEFQIDSLQFDPNCSTAGQTVTCSYGDMTVGQNRFVRVNVTPVADSASVTNTARVDGAQPDPASGNDASSATVTIARNVAGWSITKTASRPTMIDGEPDFFDVTVTNNGPAVATNAVVEDVVPANFEVTGLSGSTTGCTVGAYSPLSGTLIRCENPAVAANSGSSLRIGVIPRLPGGSAGTSASNTATVSSSNGEPQSATTNVSILPVKVDLEAFKRNNQFQDVFVLGQNGSFTIGVVNHGPAVARNVTIVDDLTDTISGRVKVTPVGIASQSAPGACTIDGQVVTCNFGDVAANGTVQAVVTAVGTELSAVDGTGNPLSARNLAQASSSSPEVSPENPAWTNSAYDDYFVFSDEVNLQAYKSTTAHGHVGVAQQYQLQAYQGSYARADDVRIDDDIPAEFRVDGFASLPAGVTCDPVPAWSPPAPTPIRCVASSINQFSYTTVLVNVTPMTVAESVSNTVNVTAPTEPGTNSASASFSSRISTLPTVSLSTSPSPSVVGQLVTARVTGNDAEGDPLRYSINWGDGGTTSGDLTPGGMDVPHTYNVDGLFTPIVTVSDDNFLTRVYASSTQAVQLDTPLVADAGSDLTTAANSPPGVTLDGSRSSPAALIQNCSAPPCYSWRVTGTGGFDQNYATKVVPNLRLPEGTYTATLTVRTNTASATDDALITIQPAAVGLTVRVVQLGGSVPITDANVAVVGPDGTTYPGTTDAFGAAQLFGLSPGEYTVFAAKYGYTPDQATVLVTGGADEVTIALQRGEIATATLKAEPMTPDEAAAAGVDLNAPENQNVIVFDINLAFRPDAPPVPFRGYVNRLGVFGGGGGGSCNGFCDIAGSAFGAPGVSVRVSSTQVGGTTQLIYMVIPVKAKWLKEFYDVTMTVQNLGSPGFTLTNGSALLDIPTTPAGNPALGLPALNGMAQQNPLPFPDVPGGESRAVQWVLRGDVPGLYDLTARYSGVLDPVALPVSLQAGTTTPFKVWGVTAVEPRVVADDRATFAQPYNLRIKLCNVTDSDPQYATPVYNLSFELLKEGGAHQIFQGGQQLLYPATGVYAQINPGECTPEAPLVVHPDFTGNLVIEESYISVQGSGDQVARGNEFLTSQPAPVSRPGISAVSAPGGVQLTWDAVPGDTSGYTIWQTVATTAIDRFTGLSYDTWEQFGETPLATVAPGVYTALAPVPDGVTQWFEVRPNGIDAKHALVVGVGGGTAPPDLSVDDVSVTEGNSGTTAAVFTVTRSGDTTGSSTVDVATADGTAVAGADYAALSSTTVAFGPGQTTQTATVNVTGDTSPEANETFDLVLSAPTGAVIADGVGTATIVNDDETTLAVDDVSVIEGNSGTTPVTFTVTRSGDTTGSATVKVRTTNGTATTGDSDYNDLRSTTVRFGHGETTKPVTVNVRGDLRFELDETFNLVLSAPTGAVISDNAGRGTIVNDDDTPTLTVDDVSVTEGNSGTTLATFTVTRAGNTTGSSTVRVKTTNGTATRADGDYTSLPSTILRFAAGETTKTVTVNVTGDTRLEADETFNLVLSAPTRAAISDASATATIVNDD